MSGYQPIGLGLNLRPTNFHFLGLRFAGNYSGNLRSGNQRITLVFNLRAQVALLAIRLGALLNFGT